MKKTLWVKCCKMLAMTFFVVSGGLIAPVSLATSETPMPYRQINVGQDYLNEGMTQVIDAMAYLGGGIDASKLNVHNLLSSPITLHQTNQKNPEDNVNKVMLANSSFPLPSKQPLWKVDPAAKNLWMVVYKGSDASGTPYCTVQNSSKDIVTKYTKDSGVLKVPFSGGADLTIDADGCHWVSHTVKLPDVTLSGNEAVIQHLHLQVNKYGILTLANNVNETDWSALKTACSQYQGDPNQVVCQVTLSIPKGNYNNAHSATLPILVNHGLRTKSIPALVNEHLSKTGNIVGPNYFQIGAKSDDLKKETKIVDLSQYFADPSVATSQQQHNVQQTASQE